MDDLTIRLRALGINRTPSSAELAKLVQTREAQKERGKALAASRPVTANQLAKLLLAKELKDLTDGKKRELGARPVPTYMIINGVKTSTTKYIVPKARQGEYSTFMQEMIDMNPKYVQKAQAMLQSKLELSKVQGGLQIGANPQYLTQDGKVYVKRLLAAGRGAEVDAWVDENQGRATRYGRLDTNGKVVTTQSRAPITPPAGIAPIPPRKKKLISSGTKRARV